MTEQNEPQIGQFWALPLNGHDVDWCVIDTSPTKVILKAERGYGTMIAHCKREAFLRAATFIPPERVNA